MNLEGLRESEELPCFPDWSELWFPRECLLELGAGIKRWVERRKGWEEDLCDPLEIGAEIEGRSQQVDCHRVEGETGGLDLEERQEGGDLELALLLCSLIAERM